MERERFMRAYFVSETTSGERRRSFRGCSANSRSRSRAKHRFEVCELRVEGKGERRRRD